MHSVASETSAVYCPVSCPWLAEAGVPPGGPSRSSAARPALWDSGFPGEGGLRIYAGPSEGGESLGGDAGGSPPGCEGSGEGGGSEQPLRPSPSVRPQGSPLVFFFFLRGLRRACSSPGGAGRSGAFYRCWQNAPDLAPQLLVPASVPPVASWGLSPGSWRRGKGARPGRTALGALWRGERSTDRKDHPGGVGDCRQKAGYGLLPKAFQPSGRGRGWR